jgi:nicotinate-nucleotide adenylyltransferase
MNPSLMENRTGASEHQVVKLKLIRSAPDGIADGAGRLGVLGGAFNPITQAHLTLAHAAREQFHLHEVIFVLSKVSPHKPLLGASIDQRLEMMRLGTTNASFISIGLCTHGLFLDIWDGLQQFYHQNPDFFFITGRDAAERILTWPYGDPERALAKMFAAFQLLVFDRHGEFILPKNPLIKQYTHRVHPVPLTIDLNHVSSNMVRRRVGADLSVQDLVPQKVAAFIKQYNLYKNPGKD